MEYNDNKSTMPADNGLALHAYSMRNDPEYAARYRFEEETANQALEDNSLLMTLAGAGIKPLSVYAMPPTHLSSRVINAIARKDPKALVGLPTKEQIGLAFHGDKAVRDKLLWQGTGNAVKLDMINDNNSNKQK